jgi:hypothetical protein
LGYFAEGDFQIRNRALPQPISIENNDNGRESVPDAHFDYRRVGGHHLPKIRVA